jgi:hypothetical protein
MAPPEQDREHEEEFGRLPLTQNHSTTGVAALAANAATDE